ILFALVLGALVGWRWPALGESLQILATIFIRLVLVIIAPLIFSTLVVGIAGQGELRKLRGLALRGVSAFMILTAVALAVGFGLAMLLDPGSGVSPAGEASFTPAAPPAESFWVRLFPSSIIEAMARGDVIQIVIFSVLLAIAISLAGEKGRPLLDFCGSLAQAMYRFTDMVMRTAPVGVFGAAAALVSRHGVQVGTSLFRLILAVYLGLGLLLFVLFPLIVWAFRLPARKFLQAVKEPFAIAFATASASAALPKAMENMEAMGVPRSIVAFIMPTGLSFNPLGSTVFIGVAAPFILQAFQISMTFEEQATLLGTLFVASKGIAGVPRSALVVTAAGLSSIGLPADVIAAGMGLLIGIDPILDMPRTATNTTGNCLVSAVVARLQGEMGPS
ncbi:MAG: dicarboxylate/amino acid:cation symporter, partial [Acidobacteria bacterium]|nr:dicarboxylate/amino acid:cation symporter [Acidobacteriota bacterium]